MNGRQKCLCKDCGGSGICMHGRQKGSVKIVGEAGFAIMGVGRAGA
jgi:hypothetical protein